MAELAARQHAVVSLAQLDALGISRSAASRRVRSGRLHRIHRAVYALVPPVLLTRDGRYLAAVLACGPGAVLSHRSAGALIGLRDHGHTKIEVTVPHRIGRHHAGLLVHRAPGLDIAEETTSSHGIPCTTPARTLLDLAAVLPRRGLERAFDQAEVLGLLDARPLRAVLGRHPHASGHKRLAAVLAQHTGGSTITLSQFEEALLALLRGARLPLPRINEWIALPDGEPAIRADFAWPAHRLVVEADGLRFHGHRAKFDSDRRKDQRLTMHGWRPVRFTWAHVTTHAARTERTLKALLHLAPPAPPTS